MRRNVWDRLSDNSSKEPSPIGAEKEKNICGYIREVRGSIANSLPAASQWDVNQKQLIKPSVEHNAVLRKSLKQSAPQTALYQVL
ncbi:hypothetical protein TNCV_3872831 [Trichonephila clavipes]|nr:hypothetical protein TNCV_3872831 [Trichonephila clavipes]